MSHLVRLAAMVVASLALVVGALSMGASAAPSDIDGNARFHTVVRQDGALLRACIDRTSSGSSFYLNVNGRRGSKQGGRFSYALIQRGRRIAASSSGYSQSASPNAIYGVKTDLRNVKSIKLRAVLKPHGAAKKVRTRRLNKIGGC